MAQVKMMKDALEKSYTNFKRNLSALTNATGRETSSSCNLQMKLDSLTEALDNLNAAHTVWKLKAELTDEQLSGEVFSDSWLQERWDEADEQIDIANDKLYLANEAARKPEVETQCLVLEERLKSLQIGIASKIDVVKRELTAENFSRATAISFAEMLADAENQLQDTHRNLSKAILSVKGDNIPATIANHETFHQTQEKRILSFDDSVNLEFTVETCTSKL